MLQPQTYEDVVEEHARSIQTKALSLPTLADLRDRWLNQVNATPLPPRGKYEFSRLLDSSARLETEPMKLLEAA